MSKFSHSPSANNLYSLLEKAQERLERYQKELDTLPKTWFYRTNKNDLIILINYEKRHVKDLKRQISAFEQMSFPFGS